MIRNRKFIVWIVTTAILVGLFAFLILMNKDDVLMALGITIVAGIIGAGVTYAYGNIKAKSISAMNSTTSKELCSDPKS